MVAIRQERGCGRQHRECSRVGRISGRTNGRRKRTKSELNTSVVPVSYSCRIKIVQAVLDRQKTGVKATIWWFCHDHDRSGRSSMIRNIGKEWSAQCDLGLNELKSAGNVCQISIPKYILSSLTLWWKGYPIILQCCYCSKVCEWLDDASAESPERKWIYICGCRTQ